MKTFKISPDLFNKIANNSCFDDLWEDILKHETEITGGGEIPQLLGGLSHFVWNATKIEIHDIGMTTGSEVYNNSFCIKPIDNITTEIRRLTIKYLLMNENERILKYITSDIGKCINITALEKLCALPKNTIKNIVNGQRHVSIKNVRVIVEALNRLGYSNIYDWYNIIKQLKNDCKTL